MHHQYTDILSRITEPPSWFDEHAVPRYGAFAPSELANIYAVEAVLVQLACQSCGKSMLAAMSRGQHDEERPLREQIIARRLSYGDPPNTGCCFAGPSMTSDMLRVIEYWSRAGFDWRRESTLELPLADAR